MSENAKLISEMVDYLPEHEQRILMELIKTMLPEEVATEEDIADILEARAEYGRGECIPLEDV